LANIRQPTKNNEDRLCLSIPETAKLLGISRNTGYEMARFGQLPTIKCGQRRLVVPKAALLKMLEEPQGKNHNNPNWR